MIYRAILSLLTGVSIIIFTQFAAIAQTATITNARHETIDQRTVVVLFDNTIQSVPVPSINGWSVSIGGVPVTVNSVTVLGTRVNVQFNATAVNGVAYILPAQSAAGVTVSYSAAAAGSNTLTNVSGNEINSFTNVVSANNFVFTCAEMIFSGISNYGSVDVCAPVTMNFQQFQFKISLRFRNSTTYNLANIFLNTTWGGGAPGVENLNPYVSDLLGVANAAFIDNAGFTGGNPGIILTSRPTHNYPASTTPAPNICSWDASITPFVNFVAACPALTQSTIFATYDNDNANSGTLSLIASPTATSNRVCLGNNVSMQFSDQTQLNCRAAVEPGVTGVPNEQTRFIRIVYGSQDLAINIPDIRVGGIPVTSNNAAGTLLFPTGYFPVGGGGIGIPDFNGVIELATPVTASTATAFMQLITTISALNHVVGDRFFVRIDYWDICNLYNPASPDANRVSIENYIEIVTKPAAPVTVNKEYCFTETFASGGTCGAPTGEYFEVTAVSVAGSTEIKWYNSLADATGDVNAITPTYGTNCRFLAPENRTGGTAALAAAGAYSVFARYRTNAVAPNNCLSDPVQVTITRRSSLSAPGVISPLTSDVCDGTNNVAYSLASAAPVVAFGGTAQYSWSFSGGAGATVDAPGTAQNITADFNITGAFTTTTRSLDVVTRFTTNATTGGNCSAGPSPRTVTIYGPTVGGTASGGTDYCQGANANNISLAGQRGSIVRWEVNFNSGGFVDAGVGSVATFDPGVLAPGNYVYQAVVANGPCVQQNSTTTTINVYQTPTTATAGIDQNLCQALALPSAGLGGNAPVTGTGVWSQISGPGTITFLPTTATANATATASAQGIYVVRWTISTGAGFCSSIENVQLDFGAPPATPDAGPAQIICTSTATLNGTVPTFETGTWSMSAAPIGGTVTFSNLISPTSTVSLSGANVFGTYLLRWRFTSGTCTPTEDFVNITFNAPATSTPMLSFTTCVDPLVLAPINLTGTVGGGATGGRWERVTGTGLMGNGTGVGSTDIGATVTDTFTPTLADLTSGSRQVRLVASGATAPCPEVGSTITITFDRRPTGVDAGAAQPLVCANPGTGLGNTTLAATALSTGETGLWTGPGGVTFGTSNSPTSTVSNLTGGVTTTLTWTVSSPLGNCANVPDVVDITVNVLPAAINPAPNNLCEVVEASGVALGINLTQYNDGVTGIVGSVNRTISWFTNASRIPAVLVPNVTSHDISNGLTLFTRVFNTTTNCFRNGVVTFTVNPLPVAADNMYEFCEEFPAGSDQVQNVDLTAAAIINPITGGVANRTVVWFNTLADATSNVNAIVGANAYDILSGSETVFARVTNTITTCVNIAEVDLVVKPRPADPTINGATNQCLNGFDLYSVTPVAGVTYIWDIDDIAATEFDVIAGGALTDFLVVVSFPNVYSGNIRLTLERNGCQSNQVTKPVTVQATPPPVTISASKDPVCENDAGIVYTATSLPLTDYTWEIPVVGGATGSSIIGGQGSNIVTVNVGATSGNIRVTPQTQGGSCAGSPATFFIDVRERPTLDTYPIIPICSDVAIGITLQVAALSTPAASYQITNVTVAPGLNPSSRALATGASNLIVGDSYLNVGNGNTPLDVRYTIVPISVEGCAGSPSDIIARIRPEPIINPNLDRTVCSREAANIVLQVASNSAPADQFEITSIVNNGGFVALAGNPITGIFLASELANDVWENTTGVRDTIKYFVRPINSVTGCIGDPPYPVLLIVNPEPQITSPTAETICSGDAPTITLVASIGGSDFDWSVKSMTGIITGGSSGTGSSINNVLINNELVQRTITYEVFATGPGGAFGTCTSQPVDVTISVDPSPVSNNVDQIVCSDVAGGNTFAEDLQALQPSINGSGLVTFTWFEDLAQTLPIVAPQLNAWPLANGIPVYVRVDNGSCQILQPVTYTVNPTPSVTGSITSNFNGFNVSCAGSSNGTITSALAAQGTPNYLYSIDGGTSYFTSRVFNGLAAIGNPYVITVRDSKGCTAQSAPMNITEPLALSATTAISSNFNGRNVSCPGASNGQITVSPLGGVAPYAYRILELPANVSGNATGIYIGLRAGTYTVFVRDANTICTVTTNTVTLVDPPTIVATATLTAPASCNGDNDGIITVVAAGGTLIGPTYTYTLNQAPGTINTTGIFSGLLAGSYSVTVRDDNNCTQVSNTITVTQPSVLTAFASVTSNYNGSKISCPAANDAEVTAIANGGNGGYTYVLVEDPGNVTGQLNGIFIGVGPGMYTVTVTDLLNCFITTTAVTVTEPTPITGSGLVSNPISCNGGADGEITIAGTGGTGAYLFTPVAPAGPSNAIGFFSGLVQGTYDFSVSDLNGCSDLVQVTISDPAIVTASALVTSNYNGSQLSCNTTVDATITVTASGGTGAFTYIFDQFPANTSGQFTGVFTSIAAGINYTFTVRDVKNCTVVTAPVNVVAPAVVAVTSATVTSNYNGQDISCVGASDGEVTILVTGGSTIIAGPTGYTYRLNEEPSNTSGNTNGVYTNVGAGSYTVTVRDANSCFVVTVPIVVDAYPAITVPASVTSLYNGGRQITCNGASDGEITISPAGGVLPFTFVLSPAINASGLNSGVFTALPAGSYTITASDVNGCSRTTSSITIVEPNVLLASASVTSNYNGQQLRCFGASDGIIKATVSGGTTNYSYVLNEIGGNVTGAASGIFTGIPAGASYTITVTDANGCSVITIPISVTPPPALIVSAVVTSNYNSEDISCNGADDAFITVTFTAGTGTGIPTYEFDQVPGNVSGKFSGIFSGVGPGLGYTFTVTDTNGCPTVTNIVDVTEPLLLGGIAVASSNYNGFDISCFNLTDGEITVTSSGGTGNPLADFTYVLLEASSNNTGTTDGTFDGLRAGSYRTLITDQNGCTFITLVIPVTQPTSISAAIDITSNYGATSADISCAGAADGAVSVRATISGGTGIVGGGAGSGISDYTYELDQDIGNIDVGGTGVFTGLTNILYTVTATDANGCIKQSLPVVLIEPLPLFEGIVGLNKSICLGNNPTAFTELATVFGGTGNYAYQWQDSIAGGGFANVIGANSATYDPPTPGVVETRYYKRLVSSGTGPSCPTLETDIVSVRVNPLPTATFIANPNPVCEGGFTILEFQFTGSAPFFFDYNDGTTFENDRIGVNSTPVFFSNLQNTTTYSITELRDINGCFAIPATLPLPVFVPVIKIDNNFSIVGPDSQCAGGQFTFQWDVDADVQYTWSFGGDVVTIGPNDPAYLPGVQTISIIRTDASTSGTINIPIVLEAESTILAGCTKIPQFDGIRIFPSVLENVSAVDTLICSGQSIRFINQSLGASTHLWSYKIKGSGDTPVQLPNVSPTIVFTNTTATNPLAYEMIYRGSNTNACFDADTMDVYVFRGVTADFTFNPPAPEYIGGQTPIVYTNTSVPADDAIFRYEWNFGSNSNPETEIGAGLVWDVDYSSPGSKNVVLKVINLAAELVGESCITTRSRTVVIQVPDFSASFSVPITASCTPLTITTVNTSGAADEFVWILRNVEQPDDTVSLSTLLEPRFIIAEPGEYDLVLIASLDALGLEETFIVNGIKVYEYPQAIFNPRPTLGFTDTRFEFRADQSYRPADPITNAIYPMDFYWDFDDNATSTLENDFYTFDLEGLYDVELKVENIHDDGIICSDSTQRTVNVKAGSGTTIPNAFTPDPSGPNDGRVYANTGKFNDVFLPFTRGVVDNGFIMQVFDRWGNLVFESRDKEIGWNGYDRNSNLLPTGVYVYKLNLEFDDGRRTTQIGDITMIR